MTIPDFIYIMIMTMAVTTGFMVWSSLGLFIVALLGGETESSGETILHSVFWPLIFVSYVLEFVDKKFNSSYKEG